MATFVAIKDNFYSSRFNSFKPAPPQKQSPPSCSQHGTCTTSCSCYLNNTECNEQNCPCGCKSSCKNISFYKLMKSEKEKLRVRQITWRNVGVVVSVILLLSIYVFILSMIYTTTDVSEGELLGEYIGVFRDCGELDKGNCHIHFTRQFKIEEYDFYVDTKIFGNFTRFIRNSCRPTAIARPVFAQDGSFHVLIQIYANQDLMQDMEVTLEWGIFNRKEIKCLLECGCATLNLISRLITDVTDNDTCEITSSRRQQKIRRSKRRIGLRHYCKTASQSLSLEQIHDFAIKVKEFFPDVVTPDPIRNNESFVPLDDTNNGIQYEPEAHVYQEDDPPRPPSPTYLFAVESNNNISQPPRPTIINIKEEPRNRVFGMARAYPELDEMMLQPIVHFSDINLNEWQPQPCLRLSLSFVNAFSLPEILVNCDLKCLHLIDCSNALKDNAIRLISRLTSLQSLWITRAPDVLPSKINSLLTNLTSLVDINFEGTCNNLTNSLTNLNKFTQLTGLNVARSAAQKADINWIPQVIPSTIHLQQLNLSFFRLDMESIKAISTLPYLTKLNIANTNPTQQVVDAMTTLNPLTFLNFASNGEASDLCQLIQHHSTLCTLLVANVIFKHPTSNNNTLHADSQLTHICTYLPKLEALDVERWPISSFGMWQLTRLQSLKFVRLFRNQTETSALQQFCGTMRQNGVTVETDDEEDVY